MEIKDAVRNAMAFAAESLSPVLFSSILHDPILHEEAVLFPSLS
jgi:hypothetical protein